jgi:hypothetical protein
MEPASPARLYAALAGAVLVVLGIAGFFHDRSWLNYLYAGTGTLGLIAAPCAPRLYALGAGALYTVLAITDFSSRGWPHLAIGLLGLAAFAGTRGSFRRNDLAKEPRDRSRRLKPRAKAATKGS